MLDRLPGGRVEAAAGDRLVVRSTTSQVDSGPSFADVLATQLGAEGIKLSAHAQQRLRQADLDLGGEAADRLRNAVERAEKKGARESLILLDDLAFVVSVKNKTVITAVEGGRARENVFTNIDSVVIG